METKGQGPRRELGGGQGTGGEGEAEIRPAGRSRRWRPRDGGGEGQCWSWAWGLRRPKDAAGGDLLLALLKPWFVIHTNQKEQRVQREAPPSSILPGQASVGFVEHTC